MVKHSENTNKSSHKFVYVSKNSRYLCWKSPDKDDEKTIELISISDVIKEGVEFYLKATGVGNLSNCLVIRS